jgi:hypothetical protein
LKELEQAAGAVLEIAAQGLVAPLMRVSLRLRQRVGAIPMERALSFQPNLDQRSVCQEMEGRVLLPCLRQVARRRGSADQVEAQESVVERVREAVFQVKGPVQAKMAQVGDQT